MFILKSRSLGPLAGVAAALIFVILLGTDGRPSDSPKAVAPQLASNPVNPN